MLTWLQNAGLQCNGFCCLKVTKFGDNVDQNPEPWLGSMRGSVLCLILKVCDSAQLRMVMLDFRVCLMPFSLFSIQYLARFSFG